MGARHRFFFTAENVYKGMLMMINYYSGKDRGNEELADGANLRLPSGCWTGAIRTLTSI